MYQKFFAPPCTSFHVIDKIDPHPSTVVITFPAFFILAFSSDDDLLNSNSFQIVSGSKSKCYKAQKVQKYALNSQLPQRAFNPCKILKEIGGSTFFFIIQI